MERAGEDGYNETDFHQLLPIVSPVRNTSVRSGPAPISNASSQSTHSPDKNRTQWLPFALRWYFVIIPAGLAIAFAVIVFVLYWRSHNNNGLGSESSAILGWKFVPTLIAVIYTQLTAMVLGALTRTEPFARLAKPIGHIPVSRYTLLMKSKPWWTTLLHGFQKKRNGGSRNWAMILSCIVYVLAILGISPISAALLSTREVEHSSSKDFARLTIRNDSALHPRAERDTYLRTMGAILQNYSTSPWITDDFVILPFWPSNSSYLGSPWDSQDVRLGSWEAETTVFRNDLVCTELHLSKSDFHLRHATKDDQMQLHNKTYLASVLLESDHDCQFNLTVNATSSLSIWDPVVFTDWMSWSDINHIMFGEIYSEDAIVRLNEGCKEDEIILMSTPWWSDPNQTPDKLLANLTIRAFACHTDHSMATIPVHAAGTSSGLSVGFDETLFYQVHTPVPSTVFDLQQLHDIYTDVAWSQFVPQKYKDSSKWGSLGGPAAMLGTGYNFSVSEMMADANLLTNAIKFRRRFFAEIIGASLQLGGASEELHPTGRQIVSARYVLVSGQAASVLCALLITSSCLLLGTMWLTRPTTRDLNIYCDPSTVLGISLWANGNPMVLSSFRTLDLATRQTLKEDLAYEVFRTKSGRFEKIESDRRVRSKVPARTPSYKSTPILPVLRLRNLFSLLLYALGLLVGIVVVFEFARRSELHQAFFTYRANVKLFGYANTISPFAIVPTMLSIIITLWWDSVDNTCRLVQPYISMYHSAKRPSQSTGLSYASSFWLWTSFKALKNQHWLLSLIATTTFLIQILTVAMSALFDSGSGVSMHPLIIPPTLELRSVPFVQKRNISLSELDWKIGPYLWPKNNPELGDMLNDVFYNLKTNWMYTAIIQTALKGPQPVWSKDDWNFVPLLSTLEASVSVQENSSGPSDIRSPANLTVQTPAIRARIECSVIESTNNLSLWLTARKSKEPSSTYLNITGLDNYYWLRETMFEGNLTTRVTAQGSYPQCCANLTEGSKQGSPYAPVVLGYWTENWRSVGGTNGNFTIKWIRGPASFAEVLGFEGVENMFFPEPPEIQALECMPSFETSEAEVTVDSTSGIVQDYRILKDPILENVAWSDATQWRNISAKPPFKNSSDSYSYIVDVTTSYGVLFMKSLLRAACLIMADSNESYLVSNPTTDRLDDKVFNMRDNTTGLNLDFMSYAAYAEVGFDPTALLDADVLLKTSQKVFSTFFQHFVNYNISHKNGGWVYQPIGHDLKVNPPMVNMPKQYTPSGAVAPKFEDVPRNTNQTTTATVSARIEVLRMNPVAFWISASIIVWLIITIIILASVQRKYYCGIMRNVECIADVLVLIAGSERLLAVINEKGIDTILKEDKILTRLGWFREPDGTMRWRIELVEDEQVQMRPIPLGTVYARVPRDDSENAESIAFSAEIFHPGTRQD